MPDNAQNAGNNHRTEDLIDEIKALQSSLKQANDTAAVFFDQYLEVQKANSMLRKQIQELEDKKKKAVVPGVPLVQDESGLGWLSRIVLLMRRKGRPMRAKEIIKEVMEMDREKGQLMWLEDRAAYLYVVLSKGTKSGRLKLFKVRGTRGGFYALDDWLDKEGNLSDEMKQHLI